MKSKLFPLLFLLLLPVAASAQKQESSWLVRTARKGFRSLTEPNKSLDSVYVLQPTFKWVVAVESEYFRTGANLNSDIILTDLRDNDPIIVNGTMKTQLVNDPYRKVGLAAGYERFGFQGIDTEMQDDDGYLRTKVKTQGTFFNFNVEGKVNVRF